MDEDLLLPFFSEFGPVAELTVIRDKINQTHKGAPAVTMTPNAD
jgi:RNA recognition motif-containing protein